MQNLNIYMNPLNDPCYREKMMLIMDCKERTGSTLDGKRPLNIAVIGRPGGGKSSFLNSVFVSFSRKEWRELAKAGAVGGGGDEHGTVIFKSYTKEDYSQELDLSLLPTFLDMKGFEDEETPKNHAIMELVLNGRIRDTEDLMETIQLAEKYGHKGILESHNKNLPKLYPVDRIIVVCTSDPGSPLPVSLFKVIKKSAREQGGIPIYGVLTCRDAHPTGNLGHRIQVFKDRLGLSDERFAHISNYCSGVDPNMIYKNTFIPSLDVPILNFMKQVLTSYHRDPRPKPTKFMYFSNLLAVFVVLVGVFMFLYFNRLHMAASSLWE